MDGNQRVFGENFTHQEFQQRLHIKVAEFCYISSKYESEVQEAKEN